MKYEIRGVQERDFPYLAANLRPEDAHEAFAASGSADRVEVLRRSVNSSEEALAGALKDGPAEVLWGIGPFSYRASLIWALASPEINNHKIAFLRNSRSILGRWFKERPNIDCFVNFTHGANELHHHWLRWLGAELYPETPVGPLGEPFRPFIIKRETYHV